MAPRALKPKRVGRGTVLFFNKTSTLVREAYGVVGLISPWNYPFGIPFHEVVLGLLAGNGVLLKVASQVQPVGDIIDSLLEEAALPEDLFQVVHLSGSEAGPAFLDSGIDKLFLPGSPL